MTAFANTNSNGTASIEQSVGVRAQVVSVCGRGTKLTTPSNGLLSALSSDFLVLRSK